MATTCLGECRGRKRARAPSPQPPEAPHMKRAFWDLASSFSRDVDDELRDVLLQDTAPLPLLPGFFGVSAVSSSSRSHHTVDLIDYASRPRSTQSTSSWETPLSYLEQSLSPVRPVLIDEACRSTAASFPDDSLFDSCAILDDFIDCLPVDPPEQETEEPAEGGEIAVDPVPSSSDVSTADKAVADNEACCWEHGCNGRKFSTRSNLLRHQIEKGKARPNFKCPICGAFFSRTTARNQHVARKSCKRVRRYSNGRERPGPRVKD